MNKVYFNFQEIKKKIENIIQENHLFSRTVRIIAVSKNQNSNIIEKAILSGIDNFGENYVQESIIKIEQLKQHKNVQWHFIGTIQSNKTKKIAQHFSWCQTIKNEKIAVLLNQFRPVTLPPINVLIQINTSGKIDIEYYTKLAKIISLLPKLKFRGIMAMPKRIHDPVKNAIQYKMINIIFHQLKKIFSSIDTLSLGTSCDIKEALYAKSNMVRIGRYIFQK